MNRINLQLQIDEIDAIIASFPDADVLILSEGEASDMAWARLLLTDINSKGEDTDEQQWPSHLSGSLKCMEGKVAARLRFVLPPGYPHIAPAHLSLECEPSIYSALSALLKLASESIQTGEGGQLLVAFSTLREAVREECESHMPADPKEGSTADSTDDREQSKGHFVRAIIWFHHIAANSKRRFIVERARELGVSGASKAGWPGVIVCQGESAAIDEYISSIKCLSWQAMQVRCLESVASSDGGFVEEFREVESEGGMAALANLCQEAGCIEMFKTWCLKL